MFNEHTLCSSIPFVTVCRGQAGQCKHNKLNVTFLFPSYFGISSSTEVPELVERKVEDIKAIKRPSKCLRNITTASYNPGFFFSFFCILEPPLMVHNSDGFYV